MQNRGVAWSSLLVLVLLLSVVSGCKEGEAPRCLGVQSCEGEWAVFSGHVGTGQACTTPAGDLHVRYEKRSSDDIVASWSKLIPTRMGVVVEHAWAGARAYRQGFYKDPASGRLLNVQVVPASGSKARTLQMTWE